MSLNDPCYYFDLLLLFITRSIDYHRTNITGSGIVLQYLIPTWVPVPGTYPSSLALNIGKAGEAKANIKTAYV